MKKTHAILAFVISGLPILLYPMAMLANIMSFAGVSSGDSSVLLTTVFYAVMVLSTLYPLVYIYSLWSYIKRKTSFHVKLPFYYLGVTALSIVLWGLLS